MNCPTPWHWPENLRFSMGDAGGAINRLAYSPEDEVYHRNVRNLRRYAERRAAHLARLADQDFADHNEQAKGRRVI